MPFADIRIADAIADITGIVVLRSGSAARGDA